MESVEGIARPAPLPVSTEEDGVSREERPTREDSSKSRRIAFACDDNPYTFEALSWALTEVATNSDTLVLVHIVKASSERKDSHEDR
jgi:hypothetical protein